MFRYIEHVIKCLLQEQQVAFFFPTSQLVGGKKSPQWLLQEDRFTDVVVHPHPVVVVNTDHLTPHSVFIGQCFENILAILGTQLEITERSPIIYEY